MTTLPDGTQVSDELIEQLKREAGIPADAKVTISVKSKLEKIEDGAVVETIERESQGEV